MPKRTSDPRFKQTTPQGTLAHKSLTMMPQRTLAQRSFKPCQRDRRPKGITKLYAQGNTGPKIFSNQY